MSEAGVIGRKALTFSPPTNSPPPAHTHSTPPGSKRRLISQKQRQPVKRVCSGSVLQIPYLCINGDLKMKRDNLVGRRRLFKQSQEMEKHTHTHRAGPPCVAGRVFVLFDGKHPSLSFSPQESFKFYANKLKADKAQTRTEE